MFTGLIERVGRLERLERKGGGTVLSISHDAWPDGLVIGESVAVSGACLTVTTTPSPTSFTADVLDETLTRTCLATRPRGAAVNLERALQLGARLGGHIVTGHIDGVGNIEAIRGAGRDRVVRVACSPQIAAQIVIKGSVALEGISLTVSATAPEWFEVCIIPHTWANTDLSELASGAAVNIETDLLGKYVLRHMEAQGLRARGIDVADLRRAGFLQDI